jgi:hypothetical protein
MIAQSEETLIQAINESIDRNANDAILSRFLSSSRKSLQEFAKANEEQVIAIETYCHFRQINASKSQRLRALFVGMEADLTVPEMLMIYRAED